MKALGLRHVFTKIIPGAMAGGPVAPDPRS